MIWSHPHDGWFYLALAAGLAGLIALAARLASAPAARGRALLALRAASLGLLVLILLNPSRVVRTRREGPTPEAIFLVDESRSMGLESPTSRALAMGELIARGEALVPAGRLPAIRRFGFGRDLYALPGGGEARRPPAEETRLGWALEQLPSRFGEGRPFAVFVFSDGRSTEPFALDATARAYRELGVPIHVAPVGDEKVAGDVAVQDLDVPRDARPGTRVPVRVTLRSHGYEGQRAEVRIRSAATPGATPLATLPVTLAGGEQAHDLTVDTDRARGPLMVEVSSLPHEAIAANNIVRFQIAPRPGKIRVIYLEGGPPEALRRLSEALAEDRDIECLDIGTTHVLGQGSLARKNDHNRGYPATRAELFGYDVVICSDIRRDSFTQEQLDWTVELVGRRGGGFAMVGGNNSYGAGQYHKTAWNGLIPVDMGQWGLERGFGNIIYWGPDKPYRVTVPPEAQGHPIWHFDDDPARNRAILEKMPNLYGCNLVDRLKPAATVLGLSDRPLLSVGRAPIFSCQTFGRGRTFAMLTDTTPDWGVDFESRWGEGDNRYFRKFWRNVVRWLGENSVGDRRLLVETDKALYRPGQEIRVTARAFDETMSATDAYRVVARLRGPAGGDSPPIDPTATDLVPRAGDRAYRGSLSAPPAGEVLEDPGSNVRELAVEGLALEGDRVAARSVAVVQVVDDPAEFRDPRPDPAGLATLAQATGGRVIRTPADLANLLASHREATATEVVTRSPLWDSPLLWLALLGSLSAEWVLRRLRGLA
jgi:uncharacterized membrane protein